jgi:hypothetical protein
MAMKVLVVKYYLFWPSGYTAMLTRERMFMFSIKDVSSCSDCSGGVNDVCGVDGHGKQKQAL